VVYLSNETSFFLNKALAYALLLFFIVPPVLKTIHSNQHHSVFIECENSSSHLHSKSNHNDALDHFYLPLVDYKKNEIEIFQNKIFKKVINKHHFFLINKSFFNFRLRGPPAF